MPSQPINPASPGPAPVLKRIDVPTGLVLEQLLPWSIRLDADRPARHTVFDLAKVGHAPPFGMLFTAACIRRYKRTVFRLHYPPSDPRALLLGVPTCECVCNRRNYYLAHMGFWRSIGEDFGNHPGEAAGNTRYLPITRVLRSDVVATASRLSREPGDVICDSTDRLAEVLVQDRGDALELTLAYAMRELFRNVFEHSRAEDLWYSAQFWPTKNRVEIAVVDEGIGILESLRRNPDLNVDNELRAVILATQRGVSGATPLPAPRSIGGELAESRWVNSGWGLFVLRELARAAGSLLVVSNTSAVLFKQDSIHSFECDFRGTAVRLVLKPGSLENLLQQILEKSTSDQPPSRLTPSMLARLRNSSR